MAKIPIARTVAQATSAPIGFAPNLVYAKRALRKIEGFGDLWQCRFVLLMVSEYARGSWKTLRGAQKRWEEGVSNGYAEVIPLMDGTFKADITFFKVLPRAADPRTDADVISERIDSPPLPRTAAIQKDLNFGLFLDESNLIESDMERDDPDRPGYKIADE